LPFTGPSSQARTIGRLVDYNTYGFLFIFSWTLNFAIDNLSGFRKRLGGPLIPAHAGIGLIL
jgi:hypothetical protein